MKSDCDVVIEKVMISNPDKVLFPKAKTTKKAVAIYYQKIAPRMLPYLKNRVISTIRCPEGTSGECFYKKHLSLYNDGIGRIDIPTNNEKDDYYYIKKPSGIIAEVQMNTIEFHIWGSKVATLERPDMLVFDLDPDEKLGLEAVRQGVKDLKSLLDEINLKSYLKTSGGKGYHIVVPIQPSVNWQQFRAFAKNIALIMETKWPKRYTSNVRKVARKNRIFIDWIRNTRSATSVAPYSLRSKNMPTVSMPIAWHELDKIAPDEITIEKAIKRLNRQDPWADFFTIRQQIKDNYYKH